MTLVHPDVGQAQNEKAPDFWSVIEQFERVLGENKLGAQMYANIEQFARENAAELLDGVDSFEAMKRTLDSLRTHLSHVVRDNSNIPEWTVDHFPTIVVDIARDVFCDRSVFPQKFMNAPQALDVERISLPNTNDLPERYAKTLKIAETQERREKRKQYQEAFRQRCDTLSDEIADRMMTCCRNSAGMNKYLERVAAALEASCNSFHEAGNARTAAFNRLSEGQGIKGNFVFFDSFYGSPAIDMWRNQCKRILDDARDKYLQRVFEYDQSQHSFGDGHTLQRIKIWLSQYSPV